MCEPSTIAAIAGVVVSAAITGAQVVANSKVQKKEAEHNHKVMLKQAKYEEEKAGMARQEAIKAARQERLSAILNINKQKSLFASSNLASSSGTFLDLSENIDNQAEMNALNAFEKSEASVSGYLNQRDSYLQKAKLIADTSSNKILSSNLEGAKKINSYLFNGKNSLYGIYQERSEKNGKQSR
ncbi:hypothetical protein II906_01010 [bacterium]|nr:hypothetical protein [bacterium]